MRNCVSDTILVRSCGRLVVTSNGAKVKPKFPRALRREIGQRAVEGVALGDLAERYGCHEAAAVREDSDVRQPLPHPGRAGHPEALRRLAVLSTWGADMVCPPQQSVHGLVR